MRIPFRVCLSGAAVTIVGLTGGCASRDERAAFAEWTRADLAQRNGQVIWTVDVPPDAESARVHHLEEDLPPGAALDDLVEYALRHHPAAAAAMDQWRAALEQIPQARALADPELHYEIDRFDDMHGVGFTQTIPWPEKLDLRARQAIERARAEAERARAVRVDVAANVRRAFAELAYVDDAINATGASLDVIRRLEASAANQYRSGRATLADVTRAQSRIDEIENSVASLEAQRLPLRARLNAALGRPFDAPLIIATRLPDARLPGPMNELVATIRHANPELAALRHEAAERRTSIAAARKESIPDVTLGYTHLVADDGEQFPMATIGINLPIWREKYDAAVRESIARFGAATKMTLDRRRALESDVAVALFELQDAERRIGLYGERLRPRAEQTLRAVDAGYRAGNSDFTDLNDATQSLIDFDLALARARADRFVAIVEIHRLVGHTAMPAAAVAAGNTQNQNTQAPAAPETHHD